VVIDICIETNKWCNFQLVDPFPPTTLPDESFDLVYHNSVFSHLSEDAHLRWLDEFHRILKPGGLMIATTWPRDLISRCAQIRAQKDILPWQRGLAASFLDTGQALAAYDRGSFVTARWAGEMCSPHHFMVRPVYRRSMSSIVGQIASSS
jgi:SAM-dependent methyltransferase